MHNITIIQANLHWQNKAANLAMFTHKIAQIKETTHLIVLPEMFTTGFTMEAATYAETMTGSTIQWMQQMAIATKAVLCGSIIIHENQNYYNRFIWMPPSGQVQYYDKKHLFGLGNENQHYTAGTTQLFTTLNGLVFNCQVCYDLRFPVWARQPTTTALQYHVLLYVANWPEVRSAAWKALLVARAIENQCYVVAVNRVGYDGNGTYHSGNSMVVSPLGEMLYHKADDEVLATITLHISEVEAIRKKFPFLGDADKFRLG